LLDVREINVFYDQFHVVQDVSLTVDAGRAIGIVGPNGHGKSTLLKALCGLVPVRSGQIRLLGERIDGLSAPDIVERGMVYVAEERHLFPDMTVGENLRLGAYLPRGRQRVRQNLDRVFDLFPRLRERDAQLARTLSGGEAQMLALARGLMSAADCMAIDEPSLGLAPRVVDEMLDAITRINQDGITVLLVEQNTSRIERFLHQIHALEDGRITGHYVPGRDGQGDS
jgi:branched-chain amino acid transport system ATP-binding protein